MNKRNILIGLSVVIVLTAAALIFYLNRLKKPQAERVITITEMANLKEGDTLIIDLKLNSFVIIDQTEGKINLKRIKVKTGDKIKPLTAMFRKKTEEELSGSKVLKLASYENSAAAGEDCCPDCAVADPSTTCCCCEVDIDDTGRYSKSCANYLAPDCKGPTVEECCGLPDC